jgi:hypothetical protein
LDHDRSDSPSRHSRSLRDERQPLDQNLGFSTGEDFARYMIDCFEVMYEEGTEHPKPMSLALHDRLTGRPGRHHWPRQVPQPHHCP